MQPLPHRSPSKALALVLVLAAGCDNQITQPPARLQPRQAIQAIQADKAPFKSVLALEPLPGSGQSYSSASSINDLGQVVGQSSSITGPHAVIWDNSTVPQDLETLSGSISSFAAAISNDGRVIAGISTDASTSHPVRWLKANGQWLIDALPNAGGCFVSGISPDGTAIAANCNSVAAVWLNGSRINLGAGWVNGVNGKGQAVGTNSAFNRALLWTFINGPVTVTDLGTLGGGFAVANGINDAGEVTGWSENANLQSHAFLSSPKKNAMTDLGAVGTTSGGYAINAAGQVVGDVWPSAQQHAGFFDRGKAVDLGALPGYSGGIALSLNNNGQAVGNSYTSSQTRATKWILK